MWNGQAVSFMQYAHPQQSPLYCVNFRDTQGPALQVVCRGGLSLATGPTQGAQPCRPSGRRIGTPPAAYARLTRQGVNTKKARVEHNERAIAR